MFTLEQFFHLPQIAWHKVITGGPDLSRIPVERISVIEMPVDDFVRENELVLSTALGCEGNDALLLELVTDIQAAGACALVLALKSNIPELPDNVREFADSRRFPIAFIPWECRFAELSEEVYASLQQDVLEEIGLYETLQGRLLEAYLGDRDMHCAARIIAEGLRVRVTIFDANHKIRGVDSKNPSPIRGESKNSQNSTNVAIENGGRVFGHILLDEAKDSRHIATALINRYLIYPLILWFEREWVIQATHQNAKDDFVWQLANSKPEKQHELEARSKLLGFSLHRPYTCVVACVFYGDYSGDAHRKWVDINIAALKEMVIETAKQDALHIMVTYQQEQLIMFVENVQYAPDRRLHAFLDSLEQRAAAVFPQLKFSFGISAISAQRSDFNALYLDARAAWELCRNNAQPGARYSYENTLLFRILSALSAEEDIRQGLTHIIAPLIQEERENALNLLETLSIYLRRRNVSETARELSVHRQTLLYRLNKIEELLGFSLKKADDVFLLELCVRLHMDSSK